jgi:hypothetical protein
MSSKHKSIIRVSAKKRFSRSHLMQKSIREGPAPSATAFNGPIHVRHKDDVIDVNLFEGYQQMVTASSSLFVNNSVFPSSTVTSAPNWGDYSGLYQEFRVLGMSVEWFPTCQNSTAPNQPYLYTTPMFLCPSSIEQTALTGDLAAWAHEGKTCAAANTYCKASIKMRSSNDATWYTCASGTTNALCIKSYLAGKATSASAVVALGYFYLQYNVQFRRSVVQNTSLTSSSSSQIRSSSLPLAQKETKTEKKDEKSDQKEKKTSLGSAHSADDEMPLSTPLLVREDAGTWIYTPKDSNIKSDKSGRSKTLPDLPYPVSLQSKY